MGSSDRRSPDAPAGDRTHYQVLGVRPSASRDEIRRAHRQLAHLMHPDRLAGATPAERALAERRMREVNAAWTVLGDAGRRRDYDRELVGVRTAGASAARPGTGGTGTGGRSHGHTDLADPEDPDEAIARARLADVDPDEPDLPPLQYWLLRRAPILAALGVAALLFVLTAYAGRGAVDGGADGSTRPDASVPAVVDVNGRCIDSELAVRVDCTGPNDGLVVNTVERAEACDPALRAIALADRIACVRIEP